MNTYHLILEPFRIDFFGRWSQNLLSKTGTDLRADAGFFSGEKAMPNQ